jgi:hypothetical protein
MLIDIGHAVRDTTRHESSSSLLFYIPVYSTSTFGMHSFDNVFCTCGLISVTCLSRRSSEMRLNGGVSWRVSVDMFAFN